jgi:hypothetical protein
MRNAPASVVIDGGADKPFDLMTVSSVYKELPGYVKFSDVDRVDGAGFAGIAATAFRDQGELTVFTRNGTTWARSAIYLYSTAADFPKIKTGWNSVQVGKSGHDQWLRVVKGAVVSFKRPERGRIIVGTPKGVLFDSVVDADKVYAPAGSYIFCSGASGDVFRIHAE